MSQLLPQFQNLNSKSESEILELISNFDSTDKYECCQVGTMVWNHAVTLKKTTLFTSKLRLFGIQKMEFGLDIENMLDANNTTEYHHLFKLVQMIITTCDSFYACLDYDTAQQVLDSGYKLFIVLKNSPDTAKYHLVGLNLKFHTCLLQWVTTNSTNCFQLANLAINEAIEYIGENEIKKLFKSCVKLSDLSIQLTDKDRWLQFFGTALDKSKCERKFYDQYRLEVGLLRGEVLVKLKKTEEAIIFVGNLLQEYVASSKLYYLGFQLLELRQATKQEFLKLLQDFKKKAVKNEASVVYSILHILAQNGCADEALAVFDELSNSDVTAREQILIHKLHIILSRNGNDDYLPAVDILSEFGELDNNTDFSKQIMIMLWNRGDLCGNSGDYSMAIKWYELSSRHLLSNLVDSRNNAKLHRKIAFCQLKLGLPCLDTALKSVGLDPRPNPNSSFLLFQIHLGLDDAEQALANLKETSYVEHAEYYLAAADYAYSMNKIDMVQSVLRIVASNTTSASVKEVKPIVIILRNLIKIQYEELPDSSQELIQNIVKSTKLLSIIKDLVECEWLFRTTYNAAIKAPKAQSLLYFEQAVKVWLMTEQANLDVVTNCLNIAVGLRLEAVFNNRENDGDDNLQKAKDLMLILKQDRFKSSLVTKFDIVILIMDGSYDEAFMAIIDCELELNVWKELAHLMIEKLKCPSRLVCKVLARLMQQIDDEKEEYSRWCRLTIRAHLESQKPDSCLEFANNMLVLCKSDAQLDQTDVLWVVVNLWNKGRELGGRNKFVELAVELSCYCQDSNQTLHIKKVYQELLQPVNR